MRGPSKYDALVFPSRVQNSTRPELQDFAWLSGSYDDLRLVTDDVDYSVDGSEVRQQCQPIHYNRCCLELDMEGRTIKADSWQLMTDSWRIKCLGELQPLHCF